jgi:hypothetical protein
MLHYGERKKAVLPYFKLISLAEKNLNRLKIVCVQIKIRFMHTAVLIQVKCGIDETTCVSCAVAPKGK